MDPLAPKKTDKSAETESALLPTIVCHCNTLNEAQMVVGLLASFGIEAIIESENYYRMLGSMVPGKGGIPVQVRKIDAEAAAEILEQNPSPPTAEE
jgi:Putative prokaryotic signal transducing protein